jgi:hypothetical protein
MHTLFACEWVALLLLQTKSMYLTCSQVLLFQVQVQVRVPDLQVRVQVQVPDPQVQVQVQVPKIGT